MQVNFAESDKEGDQLTLSETRYESTGGRVFLTGIQALVRLPMEQMRRDASAGLRTRAFITGYPGSPLGGYDIALKQANALLTRLGIKHVPGQNEELAATSLIGTQMLDSHPHPDVDGVVGFWYGKGPGVDRSSDALKHGNFGGTSRHGAVVILSGEDHEAKSSSVPYQQEFAFEHYGIPVLYPSSVSEFIEFGLHAVALSRFSGCWVALKLVAPLCDGGEVVELGQDSYPILPEVIIDGKPFSKVANFTYFPVLNVATEHQLYAERHVAVAAYAKANDLNRIVVAGTKDRIGIISAGKSFTDTRQALADLGYSDDDLRSAGIRLAKVGLLCPSSPDFFREFARGLDYVVVVEEKRDFLERLVGAALCGIGSVRLAGKSDLDSKPLFPVAGGMDVDAVAVGLGRELGRHLILPDAGVARLRRLAAAKQQTLARALPRRTPNYCSGCPHNVSTKLAPGQMAWGAPGCHVFAAVMEQPERRIEAMTQFGGEGLPWIGLSPYTTRPHIVQNVGDGSLFHSSLQNIRFAVSTHQTMTFRILYNGVIANTGGQESVGRAPIVNLLDRLVADGVERIVLVTKDRRDYARSRLPAKVVLREPNEVQAAMAELEKTEGVTILIYDGDCANERRRRQKRGRVAPSTKFTIVNEDVCENCGDCGRKANCMSLQKVPTEFGPKTQIHQSSCNQDRSCVEGECPSFVSVRVRPGTGFAKPAMPNLPSEGPEPLLPGLERPFHIYIPGVGGTGVITANAILAQAAAMDGHYVKSFDQTGAAQKWGPVLSSLIISRAGETTISNKVAVGGADLYLAFDLMAATELSNLAVCDAQRTAAVINIDVLPSGEMIRNVNTIVRPAEMADVIVDRTQSTRALKLSARTTAERLFGDYMMANMVAIGAAYQAGLLPISAVNIERSIKLNGAAADANIQAFRAGRLSQYDPNRFAQMLKVDYGVLADRLHGRSSSAPGAAEVTRILSLVPSLAPELVGTVRTRIADLIGYQNEAYAERFAGVVQTFAAAAQTMHAAPEREMTELVVRNLHKIMSYKDEYEVARLLTDRVFAERVKALFPGFEGMAYNLQPPFARTFGLSSKIEMGTWFNMPLRLLAFMRRVRGSAFDPFLINKVRREERDLVDWYIEIIYRCSQSLSFFNRDAVVDLLNLPESIRGYEHIKLESSTAARIKATKLLSMLQSTTPSLVLLT